MIKEPNAKGTGAMHARERLYLTADKNRLVRHGDPKAAFLYAAEGDLIPDSAVSKFGVVDGRLKPQARVVEPGDTLEKPETPPTPKPEEKPTPKPEDKPKPAAKKAAPRKRATNKKA